MITSAKKYTKQQQQQQQRKKQKKWKERTLGQMVKAKLYRQITQRSIHIHSVKKRKTKKKFIYKKKEESNQINKQIYQ